MIDITTYRIRIGLFKQKICTTKENCDSRGRVTNLNRNLELKLLLKLLLLVLVISSTSLGENLQSEGRVLSWSCRGKCNTGTSSREKQLQWLQLFRNGRSQEPNFKARYLHGNIKRGIVNIHVNIRSLYNKMSEIKRLVHQERPHILGISECELKKSHHNLDQLKVAGYDLLLPKSWQVHGKARVVVFIKKSLYYEHLEDLENEDIQSVWLRAGFKNMKKIYYSHQYREHTGTLGSSIAAQRTALEKMLEQWEEAIVHSNPDVPNEVHIAGDMNLNSLGGRWLETDYPLVSLSRMVLDTCNASNFSQLVDSITRSQYNSIRNVTDVSCIDHLYCNARHRVSPVKVLSFGASDHDAIIYTRYSKEPVPPARTIRKRSYKNFDKDKYLADIASLDFSDVFTCLDVDLAAELLTAKIVNVLNNHAPWIIFQQRRNNSPWITPETLKLMEERDQIKEKAKVMASMEGKEASLEQAELWKHYRQLRNKVNNRKSQEEIIYNRRKVTECKDSPAQVWSLAKKLMEWVSPGPPTQLEVEVNKKITLYTKACDLARVMNEFFIGKVENIVKGLKKLPKDMTGCVKIMKDRRISLSMKFVTVKKVRKLLGNLKSKTSTAVDQLDNFAVKIAADHLAEPLHHVITLSIMQQRFPRSWKLAKIVPLHKKDSQMKRENYRPVAILSPLSKVLEKVMYEHLYNYFSRNNLFHPSLHGYRRNRSTMTALLSLYEKWVIAAKDGQVSGVVLVDLSAAFDLVSPDLLIEKLKIYGLEDDIINWISSYLTDRFQAVWIDHVFSSFLKNTIGVPQGSNLGPLFFLIFFNDLPTFINEEVDCYADDSTMGATAKTIVEIGNKLSDDCSNLSDWMAQNSFKLNAGKTHLMTIGTGQRLLSLDTKLEVVMDGVVLEETEEKFEVLLGIFIQNDLKWSKQVLELTGKLKKRLAGLNRLRFILDFKIRKNIVQGVFNSVLCYCLPLFGGCAKGEIQALQVQQNQAAQIVLKLPPRSSRDFMYTKLNWLTVHQLITYHTLIAVYRIRNSKEPEYLANILCRDNKKGNIVMKNTDLGLYRSSFIFRGSVSWNELPDDLKLEKKIGKFKVELKKWVIEKIPRFIS